MQGDGQPQQMYGYLQFEIAGACHPTMTGNSLNSWRPVNSYANSRLPESLFSTPQRGIFRNQPSVSNPARHFQSALCAARTPETLNRMARSTHHAGDIHILAPGNFGLHLNRTGRAAPVGSAMVADVTFAGFLSTRS